MTAINIVGFVIFFVFSVAFCVGLRWRARIPRVAGFFLVGLGGVLIAGVVIGEVLIGGTSVWVLISLGEGLASGAPAKLGAGAGLVLGGLMIALPKVRS